MRQNPLRTAVFSLAGVLILAPAGLAQNALGDGTVLDRNLRVGSRANQRSRDIDSQIRFNNAIVTGNAAYGRSFRGDVGYLSSSDFRASLGSNDLFAFQRDASPTTNITSGIRGTTALQYQFMLVTGNALPPVLASVTPIVERAGYGASGASVGSGLRSVAEFESSRSLKSSVIGYTRNKEGVTLAITANPLTGLQQVAVPQLVNDLESDPLNPEARLFARPGLSGQESTARGVESTLIASRGIQNQVTDRKVKRVQNDYNSVIERFEDRYKTEETPEDAETEEPIDRRPQWERDLDALRQQLQEQRDAAETEPQVIDPTDPSTRRAIESLRNSGVRIESLQPVRKTDHELYSRHMEAAEQFMADERYFDAEIAFTRALAAVTGEPLARLGRVSSQLGAGLYLSSGLNLRKTFSDHPELISTTLSDRLFPTARRQTHLIESLRTQVKAGAKTTQQEAALLLAWIGHHQDDSAMIAEGLTALRERTDAEDTKAMNFVSLLESVWIFKP